MMNPMWPAYRDTAYGLLPNAMDDDPPPVEDFET